MGCCPASPGAKCSAGSSGSGRLPLSASGSSVSRAEAWQRQAVSTPRVCRVRVARLSQAGSQTTVMGVLADRASQSWIFRSSIPRRVAPVLAQTSRPASIISSAAAARVSTGVLWTMRCSGCRRVPMSACHRTAPVLGSSVRSPSRGWPPAVVGGTERANQKRSWRHAGVGSAVRAPSGHNCEVSIGTPAKCSFVSAARRSTASSAFLCRVGITTHCPPAAAAPRVSASGTAAMGWGAISRNRS